ncbi:MAG TPA: hypothetical protein VLK84_09260 [Longimicrobium sp.]|nr:hypothetical protein [Longimicrobium sp.]
MRMLQRLVARGLVAAAACTALAAAPAAAAPVADTFAPAMQCLLQPGVYGITDSNGALVGLLIVYPDCRMEVYRRPPGEE